MWYDSILSSMEDACGVNEIRPIEIRSLCHERPRQVDRCLPADRLEPVVSCAFPHRHDLWTEIRSNQVGMTECGGKEHQMKRMIPQARRALATAKPPNEDPMRAS